MVCIRSTQKSQSASKRLPVHTHMSVPPGASYALPMDQHTHMHTTASQTPCHVIACPNESAGTPHTDSPCEAGPQALQ